MPPAQYYSAADRHAALITVFIAFMAFLATMAPTVTLEASGQLVVAAEHLGVGRTPGYPVWTLLAKGFILLFPLAEYHGHPNPAWAVNLMSVVFGALACGTLALMASRLSSELLPATPAKLRTLPGILAGLLFAFSPGWWSQAVIAETHTLTNFYFLGWLALTLRWMHSGQKEPPWLLIFLTGLGLAVSQLLILNLPLLLLAAAFVAWRTFARLALALGLFGAFLLAEFTWGPVRAGLPNGILAGAILAGTLLLAAGLAVPRSMRSAAGMLILLLAGLLPYAYLPLAAAHNPPMNMGQACTWEGFWHVIQRGQFEAITWLNPLAEPGKFMQALIWYARLVAMQFTAPLAAAALLPILHLPWTPRRLQPAMLLMVAAIGFFAFVVLCGCNPLPDIQNTLASRVVFLPSFALVALLASLGWVLLLRSAWRFRAPLPGTAS